MIKSRIVATVEVILQVQILMILLMILQMILLMIRQMIVQAIAQVIANQMTTHQAVLAIQMTMMPMIRLLPLKYTNNSHLMSGKVPNKTNMRKMS